jgi:hypothetical protein
MHCKKTYIVLLEDEPVVGLMMQKTVDQIMLRERALPTNLTLIHFKTSRLFCDWIAVRENRLATVFFIIDKNLDVESDDGDVLYTENGIEIFAAARDQYRDELATTEFAVFSGDRSLNPETLRSHFPSLDRKILFLEKPISERELFITYTLLLRLMLSSALFWEAVKKFNGDEFEGSNYLDAI